VLARRGKARLTSLAGSTHLVSKIAGHLADCATIAILEATSNLNSGVGI
jgi:hypothetical protein